MGLAADLLGQRRGQPRLADARLAGNQHHPSFAGLRLCQRRSSSSISSSRPTSGVSPERSASNRLNMPLSPNDPPRALRLGKAGELLRAEVFQIEQPADLPAGRFGDDQRIRHGERLQPGREVRRLANDRRAPVPHPRRSDRRPRRARWRCRGGRSNLLAPAIGRPPRSRPGRRAPPARHRPHALPASRNRSAPRRPCTWR